MIETLQVVETPAQRVAILHIETPRSKMQHASARSQPPTLPIGAPN